MRKLPLSMAHNASCINRFLIKEEADLARAVGNTIIEENLNANPYIYGKDHLPTEYPYVLIVYADQEYNLIDLNAVTPNDFKETV